MAAPPADAAYNIVNAGRIDGDTSAPGNIVNSGTIGGRTTAGGNVENTGTLDGRVRAGGSVTNSGNIDGDIIAGGDIDIGGRVNAALLQAGNNILVSGSLTGRADSGLTLQAVQLILAGARIYSPAAMNIGTPLQITQVIFSGGGTTVWVHGDLGVKNEVYYRLPEGGDYGNILGSETGKLWVQADNLKAIKANPQYQGYLAPAGSSRSDWTPAAGLNLFVNGFQSGQPGNLVNVDVSIVAKPVDLPDVPNDPCGNGSSLEFKQSNGVVLAYEQILPFSVFGDAPLSLSLAAADRLSVTFDAPSTGRSCGKA